MIQRLVDFSTRHVGSLVYGANDGIITTFAIITSAVGASVSTTTVIILGFANLFADGFSMGASSYLAARSEKTPDGMTERDHRHDAQVTGAATFGAFVVAGVLPLIPFLLPAFAHAFILSMILTAAAFFVIGGARSFVTKRSFFWSGIEMLFVGGCAAAIAYLVGWSIDSMVS